MTQRRRVSLAPLVASIEGIANTPAYRGLAVAVFENLELAEYGNRIPFLTFELLGDGEPPQVAAILDDASRGTIASSLDRSIMGYAAYGASIQTALQPLVDCFGIELFDDGFGLRSPAVSALVPITEDELGNSADARPAARIQKERASARDIPGLLRLGYYDPARDYQAGEARAVAAESNAGSLHRELAAVIDAHTAKSLAQQMLGRAWAVRERITLRLPPSYIGLEPGIEIQLAPQSSWAVEKATIEGFVTVVELRPKAMPIPALEGDSGRIAANADVVASEPVMAVFEVPRETGETSDDSAIMLVGTAATPGWKTRLVEIEVAGQRIMARTAGRKAKLGRASSVLGPADPDPIDTVNNVEVQLIDPLQWLVSCDDEALATGANAAILGNEIVQFGDALPIGSGKFRLSRLLRGRLGTADALGTHSVGEWFVLLEAEGMRRIECPVWRKGLINEMSAADLLRSSTTPTASTRPTVTLRSGACGTV